MSVEADDKKARLKWLLDKQSATASVPAIPHCDVGEAGALSYAQQGLYFVHRLEGANPAYNVPLLARFEGRLDITALRSSVARIVHRHDSLRTRFETSEGGVRARVVESLAIALSVEPVDPAHADAVYEACARTPFEMVGDPLFRARLFRESATRHALVVTMHHSISDAWSAGIFLRELTMFYAQALGSAEADAEPLAVSYADYAVWESGWLASGPMKEQTAYWTKRLRDPPMPLALPVSQSRAELSPLAGATAHFACGPELLAKLRVLAKQSRCTVFVILQTALFALLRRYTMQDDIVVATGVSNRPRRELEGLIGYFVNTVLIRCECPAALPFSELIERVRAGINDAQAYRDAPFHKVAEAIRVDSGVSIASLLQVMFTMQNVEFVRESALPDLRATFEVPDSGAAKFDLSIAVQQVGDGLRGQIEYRRRLFDAATIERMCVHYVALLEAVCKDPHIALRDIEFLSPTERERLRVFCNANDAAVREDRDLADIFREVAARHAGEPALIDARGVVDYRTLDARAGALARRLIAEGAQAGDRIAICAERSREAVVAILATIQAGCTYVPFEPDVPAERARSMIQDSGARILLCEDSVAAALATPGVRRLPLFDAEIAAETMPGVPVRSAGGRGLAYVMYTSGSTGEPKGAAIEHRGIVRLVCAPDYVELGSQTRMFLHSPLSFDAATFEIWGALLNGGAIVIWGGRTSDVQGMADCAAHHGVDTVFLTVGLLQPWIAAHREAGVRLRYLLCGGEVLPPQTVAAFMAIAPETQVINAYGPTENTTFSTWHPIGESDVDAPTLPIGRPIRGTYALVLDETLNLQPEGCIGELCLGGAGVGRGYLNRPELTRARFVRDPYSSNEDDILYRSGDIVRWRADGALEFVGRRDAQVKLRGFRIELGEIEHHVLAFPEVDACVVVVDDHPSVGKRLIAYVSAASLVGDAAADPRATWVECARAALSAVLPSPMVPSAFVVLPLLPVNANGKVDRRALPPVDDAEVSDVAYLAPRTTTQAALAEIWSELLGVGRVGVHDDFFRLGGHSLLSIRLVSAVRDRLGAEIDIRDVFESPGLDGMSARIERRLGGVADSPIVASGAEGESPASFAQQRLWFIDRMDGGSPQYNIFGAFDVEGDFDPEAAEGAFSAVVARHAPLRTIFVQSEEGAVLQKPLLEWRFVLDRIDLHASGVSATAHQLSALIEDESSHVFDLSRELMLRARWVRTADSAGVLLLNIHHIAADGWSIGVLMHEFSRAYRAFRGHTEDALAPLPVSYADFSRWQRSWLSGERLEAQLGFWRKQLAGAPAVHALPLDRPRPERRSFAGATVSLAVPAGLFERLRGLARERGATFFMALHAAYATLLSRHSAMDDIVLGTPVANRTRSELEPLIGFFVNMLVLRTDCGGDPRFSDFLAHVRTVDLEAQAHQDIPFEYLVEKLNPERSAAHAPLFQLLLSLNNNAPPAIDIPDARMRMRASDERLAKFELILDVFEGGDEDALHFVYNSDLFDATTVAAMGRRLLRLLTDAVQRPDARLSELQWLDAEDMALLDEHHAPSVPFDEHVLLHETLALSASRSPSRLAVADAVEAIDYAEFEARSNRLSRYLRANGVGPDCVVAICMDRCVDMVVAIFAILKAGGAYVPILPEYPRERIGFMLRDSGSHLVLTHGAHADRMEPGHATLLELDDPGLRDALDALASSPLPRLSGQHARNLAYVIYTSGSTGLPKGVMVEHRQVANLLLNLDRVLPACEGPWAWLLAYAFDGSLLGISALAMGRGIVVIDERRRHDADALRVLLERYRPGFIDGTPSLFESLLNIGLGDVLPNVAFGGEAIAPEAWRRMVEWSSQRGLTITNMYGPTETCVANTSARVEGDVPNIGYGWANIRCHVLDPALRPLPAGCVGELYVGGDCLARGYLNQPDLTRERFIENPAAPEARLYRTGDLVRRLRDGTLIFVGRNDAQVKLRGYRIELGEIESALLRQQGVAATAVVVREERLVAYLVGGEDIDANALRARMLETLPSHMAPAAFVRIEEMPLTPNGKVDVRALPPPAANDYAVREYAAPIGAVETALAAIWSEILGVGTVGRDDDFFQLGGHSLLAVRMVSRIRRRLSRELPLSAVFDAPTLVSMAAAIERADWAEDEGIPTLPRDAPLPVSLAQKRLWLLTRMGSDPSVYHIGGGLRLHGEPHLAALRSAIETIIARHEALRTRFVLVDDVPMQHFEAVPDDALAYLDLSDSEDPEQAARRLGREWLRRPFDLAVDPPFRARLLRLAGDRHELQIAMHHIVSDGWSIGVFLTELSRLYAAFKNGALDPLPPLPVQYGDYAQWQRTRLVRLGEDRLADFWRRTLAGAPALLELPTDRPRPPQQDPAGAEIPVTVDTVLCSALRSLAHDAGVTLYIVLLAAWAVVLGRLAGQETVVVGSPLAGRGRPEIEPLIGFFVDTLPLRIDLDGAPDVRSLLVRVRDGMLAMQAHQQLPFDRIVAAVQPPRDAARTPIFQAVLALQNQDMQQLVLDGLEVEEVALAEPMAPFDLTLNLQETDGGLRGSLIYATALFDGSTVSRHMHYWTRLLWSMVEDPTRSVGDIALADEIELEWLRRHGTGEQRPFPRNTPVHVLVSAVAAARPRACALLQDGRSLDYGTLELHSEVIARALRGCGSGPGEFVALCTARGVDSVIAMLGALKAGAAYVPIDTSYPEERIAYMLRDCGARVAIGSLARPEFGASWLDPDMPYIHLAAELARAEQGGAQQQEPTPRAVSESDPAYVIYTSGTTGAPKGVVIEHRTLVMRTTLLAEDCGIGPADRCVHMASTSFDASVLEIFPALLSGASLLLRGDERWSPEDLVDRIERNRATVVFVHPGYLDALLGDAAQRRMTDLRTIMVGGEATASDTVRGRRFAQTIVNLYGPTEATIFATSFTLRSDAAHGLRTPMLPLGRPVANTVIRLLDSAQRQVPIGAVGELHIGGEGLARGYHRRPELTAERFVPDLFAERPSTLYRTGDLARWRDDGMLEFLGRIDSQVKLRGFRIELGEIESALAACDGVERAVVVARRDVHRDLRLIAYCSGVDVPGPVPLRAALAKRVPDYMLPSAYVRVDVWPTLPNGKLARDALPDPERSAYGGDVSEAPRPGLESELAAMWADVLGIKDIGRHDAFFEIGGDSMKVVALLARLSASHPQSQVAHLDFYRDPTVAGLAALLLERTPDYMHEALPILAGSEARAPLTLLCVPYAGGSPAVYMPLADALQACMPGVCVRAVAVLSSSDDEVGVTEIADIADALMPQVLALDGDLVLYGHSAGSALAIALARRIEAAGRSLRLLVLGAVLPPIDDMRALPMHDPFADLDDDALRAEMAAWGLAPGSIDEPSLANVLSGFRRDAGRALRYHLGPDVTAVVAPVLTMLGGDDPTTDGDQKRHLDWPFLIGDHRLAIISGGDHYFVQRLPAEVADVLDNTLADMPATTGGMRWSRSERR